MTQQQVHTEFADGLEIREACLPHRVLEDTYILFCPGVAHHANFFDSWSTQLALGDGIRSGAVSLRGHGRSTPALSVHELNQLCLADYEEDLLKAITHTERQAKEIVCIGHSMGARVLYNLAHRGNLPDTVKGAVLLNPVPDNGILRSCATALLRDMVVNHRATPITFPYALFIRKNLEDYFKSNPERILSIFFSSDSEKESRLKDMTAQQFCDWHLCGESTKVVTEILFPTRVKARRLNIPFHTEGTDNDRIISHRDLIRMQRRLEMRGCSSSSLIIHRDTSHDSPLDKDGHKMLESILNWMKSESLLRVCSPQISEDIRSY